MIISAIAIEIRKQGLAGQMAQGEHTKYQLELRGPQRCEVRNSTDKSHDNN